MRSWNKFWRLLSNGGVLALMATAAFVSCNDDAPACYDGEYRACVCGDLFGYQQCNASAYGACDCETSPPGLGGGPPGASDGGGGSGGGLLPFMAPCDEDAQCETGLCFSFIAKGPHCSKPCTSPDECEPPSEGCSGMGVCKAP